MSARPPSSPLRPPASSLPQFLRGVRKDEPLFKPGPDPTGGGEIGANPKTTGSWSGIAVNSSSPTLEETLESLGMDDDMPDVDLGDVIPSDQALDAVEPTLPLELTPEYRSQLPPLPAAL